MIPSPFEARQMLSSFFSGLPDRLTPGYNVSRLPYTLPDDPTRLDELVGAGVGAWNTGADLSNFVRSAPGTVLSGLAGLPGQAADYLTTPRSQRLQRPLPSFSDVESGSSTDFAGSGVQSGASTTAGQPAATSSAPTRAIRMPNGSFLFTNRAEYGGEEFSPAQAGQMMRAAGQTLAAAGPIYDVRPQSEFAGKSYNWPGPAEATMRSLIAASARARAGDPPPSQSLAARGRMTEGFRMQPGPGGFAPSPDNLTGAAMSQIHGTPDQQMDLQLRQAAGVAALAQLGQQERAAKLNPMEAATLGSPQAVAMLVASQLLGPKIQEKQAITQARIAALSQPSTPDFIADERRRALVADEIQQNAQAEIANLFATLGLRPPSGI